MPVLPLIDLMILLGWTSLLVAFAQKAIWLTTTFRPTIFGLLPNDFLLAAGICLLFSLSLAARTWVKAHEPGLLSRRRRGAVEPDLVEGFDARGFPIAPYENDAADRRTGAAAGR